MSKIISKIDMSHCSIHIQKVHRKVVCHIRVFIFKRCIEHEHHIVKMRLKKCICHTGKFISRKCIKAECHTSIFILRKCITALYHIGFFRFKKCIGQAGRQGHGQASVTPMLSDCYTFVAELLTDVCRVDSFRPLPFQVLAVS